MTTEKPKNTETNDASSSKINAPVENVEKDLAKSSKKKKSSKQKVIRDRFPFPEKDYLKMTELKKICLAEGLQVKRGELLRAGLHLLAKLSVADLKLAVEQVEKIKKNRK